MALLQAGPLTADAGQCARCAALQEALAQMAAELAGMRAKHEQMGAQLQRACAIEHAMGLAAAVRAAQGRMAALQAEGEALQLETPEPCMAAPQSPARCSPINHDVPQRVQLLAHCLQPAGVCLCRQQCRASW